MNTYDFKLKHEPLFEKYVIDKSYGIKKMRDDGSEVEIVDTEEKYIILNTNFLAGSFAISRDTGHNGTWSWHPLFYVGQKIHKFVRQRHGDENMCHGMIYLEKVQPDPGQESTYPFLIAHAIAEGVHTSKDDYVPQEDVTEVVVYRPRSDSFRKEIIRHSLQTAFNNHSELLHENPPNAISPFSYFQLIASGFCNGKHEVCGKEGSRPTWKMMENSAYFFADLFLGNQILDSNGEPKAMFCNAYATGILQGSFIWDSLKKKFTEEQLKDFIQKKGNDKLDRQVLAHKILQCFRHDDRKNPVAHELWRLYWGNKFVRMNFENLMSIYLTKNLDKLSKKREEITTTYNVVTYERPKEVDWLEKTIRWYKDEISMPPLVKKIVAYITMGIILAVSLGILLPLVFKVQLISYKRDLEKAAEKFKAEMAEKIKLNPALRPALGRVELKTEVSAFNHVSEFTLHEGVIWSRKRDIPGAEWQPIFFDGDLIGTKPVRLSADGANLVVIDDRGVVHYRKVLSEGRGYMDIHNNPNLKRHLELHPEIRIHPKDEDSYFAVDKTERANWQHSWYNFPILKHLANCLSGPELVSKGRISHLGKNAGGFTDAAGNYYRTHVGVTTLYEMVPDGTALLKYDPWVPTWSKVVVAFPKS